MDERDESRDLISLSKRRRSSSGNSSDEDSSSNRKRFRSYSRSVSPSALFEISTEPDLYVNDSKREGAYISYSYIEPPDTNPYATLSILGESIDPMFFTSSSSHSCFNCSSTDHASTSCPKPKDQKLISINRLKFQAENPSIGGENGGGKLGGDDSERSRMLRFAETFKAGVVGEDLRYALGFGKADTNKSDEVEEIIDYPWFNRFILWGYPKGWTRRENEPDPIEAVKDRIGRDIDWENVEVLALIHGDESDSLQSDPPLSTSSEQVIIAQPLSFTSPPPPPPPLPPGSPPPLPSEPPPPLPPTRLIHYPTTLFNSDLLSIHQPGYLLPRIISDTPQQSTPQPFQFHSAQSSPYNSRQQQQSFSYNNQYSRFNNYQQQQTINSPRSIPLPLSSPVVVKEREKEVREESESEMEMEISSGAED